MLRDVSETNKLHCRVVIAKLSLVSQAYKTKDESSLYRYGEKKTVIATFTSNVIQYYRNKSFSLQERTPIKL